MVPDKNKDIENGKGEVAEVEPASTETEAEDSKLLMKRIVYSIFALVLLTLIFLDYALNFAIGAPGSGVPLFNSSLYMVFLLAIPIFFPLSNSALNHIKNHGVKASKPEQKQNTIKDKPKTKSVRFYFLDSLKVFLTFLVVFVHSLQWTYLNVYAPFYSKYPIIVNGTSTNIYDFAMSPSEELLPNLYDVSAVFAQLPNTFFMPLFFFISGINLPRSFEKRAVFVFIKDKMKRLGLPLMFTYFIWDPIVNWAIWVNLGPNYDNYASLRIYSTNVRTTWYLFMLIILCISYIMLHDVVKFVKLPLPSFPVAFMVGGFLALVELCSMVGIVVWSDSDAHWTDPVHIAIDTFIVAQTPAYLGSWAYDISFFYFGCIAGNNKWLEELKEAQKKVSFRAPIYVVGVLGLIMWSLLFHYSLNELIADNNHPATFFTLWAMKTMTTVPVSYALIVFFSENVDFQNCFLKFAAAAAYGVYILHFQLLALWQMAYVAMTSGVWKDYDYGKNLPENDETFMESVKGVILGSWFWVFGITVLTTWPFIYYVRQLPGLRNVI